MKQLPPFKNLVELMEYFNKGSATDYLKSVIWNGNQNPSACPRCGHTSTYKFKNSDTYKCSGCKKKFNVFTNTIFENTKLPLIKWIACLYMATTYKRGISSVQVARNIGVTQKTAWFMMQRIRVMFTNLAPEALEGVCTADETFIGGKNKNRHADKKYKYERDTRSFPDKIDVFGVMEVGPKGRVVTQVIPDVKMSTLQGAVMKYVKKKSTIMTDEWKGYQYLHYHYDHMICNHARYQYVSDEGATTNPIENYWSHVKRAVIGTYYHLSRKHISRYLSEFDYKFNTRNETEYDRFRMTLANAHGRLKYKQLIAPTDESKGKQADLF